MINSQSFDIKSTIVSTLKPIELPISFGSAKDVGIYPFIVFSVNEIPTNYFDDDFHAFEYLVAISIYCKRGIDYSDKQTQIVSLMRKAGFKLEGVPPVQYIETEEIYNQPIAFTYYYEIDEE